MGERVQAYPFPRAKRGNFPKSTPLILFVDVCVKTVFELGKNFPWPKPQRCLRCGGRIWGHGYTEACFDGFDVPLLLRRYRCPDCRAIYRLRPGGYWSRFQASIGTIREHLSHRLFHQRWKPDLPRSRQRHWLKGLKKQIRFHLGPGWSLRPGDLLEAFDKLTARGIIPVSRAIQCESPSAV